MSAPLTDHQAAIQSFKGILSQEPTQWPLYKSLAALVPKPVEQAQILLKGAWHALEKKEYKVAEEFASDAHKSHGNLFFARLIDIELLKRQSQEAHIPKKLLEIADIFKQKGLTAQELKACKMLARLEPNSAYYERVVDLYTQTGNSQKAVKWAERLTDLNSKKSPQKLEEQQTATISPPSKALQTAFKEPTETKQAAVIEGPLISPSQSSKLPYNAFGKALWEQFIGDVGEEPPLPADIEKILNRPCPYWPGKEVKATHILVLIPETVNGKPLTLETFFYQLIPKLRQDMTRYSAAQYQTSYWDLGSYTHPPAPKSHWVLMTRDVIPDSPGKSYHEQDALIKEPYEIPAVLEAAVCVFVDNFRMADCFYDERLKTRKRCQDIYNDTSYLCVEDSSYNLRKRFLSISSSESGKCGIALLRRFGGEPTVSSLSKAPQIAFKEPAETKRTTATIGWPTISISKSSKLPKIAFGKDQWEAFIGDVGVEPPLPPDIEKILDSPCPFWSSIFSRKKVGETHMLVLIPETVNGKPLTLRALGELVQKPRQGKATQYSGFNCGNYTDPPVPKSYWALMSRDVIPASRGKRYEKQAALVKQPYEVPTVLDAAVCIFMEYFRTGKRLYGCDPLTATICQGGYSKDGNHLYVGFFCRDGTECLEGLEVDVDQFRDNCPAQGVGAMRKL